MPDTNKNALAELAKVMDEPVDMASIHDRGLVVLNAKQFSAYQKAQRIVEELAKVRDTNWSAGYNYPEPNSSSVAVSKCREIAEEGVNNGK